MFTPDPGPIDIKWEEIQEIISNIDLNKAAWG